MNIPYMDPYGSYDVMNGDKFFGPAKSRVQRLQLQSGSGPELASGPVSFFAEISISEMNAQKVVERPTAILACGPFWGWFL